MIKLDYSYMMADAVGADRGITDSELKGVHSAASAVHRELMLQRNSGLLPVYDLPADNAMLDRVLHLAGEIAAEFDNLVVLGIGGSALGTIAVARALLPLHHNLLDRDRRGGRPRLFVLDNVDPTGVGETLDLLEPDRTCFLVISKSGTTVETMSQFLVAREWVRNAVGEDFHRHFILITDAEQGVLRQQVISGGYRSEVVPAGVGGRFSVLSPVGLLPLAAAGVDVAALLSGASRFTEQVLQDDYMANPAYLMASLNVLAYRKGMPINVMMPYSDRLRDIADWFRQLWAESLGKERNLSGEKVNVGPTPVNALGATDQHSQVQLYIEGPFDKTVLFLAVEQMPDLPLPDAIDIEELQYLQGHTLFEVLSYELQATATALAQHGRANATLSLEAVTPEHIGALICMLQVQTLFAGGLLAVNPVDQPGVEAGKINTMALLERPGTAADRARLETFRDSVPKRVLEA